MSASAAKSKKRSKKKKQINIKRRIIKVVSDTNLQQNLKVSSGIRDVIDCYTQEEAYNMLCLLDAIHRSFDSIIQDRLIGSSFQNRTNKSLMYNINLNRILRENGVVRGTQNSKIRDICFGPGFDDLTAQQKEEKQGLLIWYTQPLKKPVLCQIVNPYDVKSRQTQLLVLEALSATSDDSSPFNQPWKNLEGDKLTHFLRFQQNAYAKAKKGNSSAAVPVPLVMEKMVEFIGANSEQKQEISIKNLNSDTYKKLKGRTRIKDNINLENARVQFQNWLNGRKIKGGKGGGIFKLTGKLTEWLVNNRSGVPLLTPSANSWMKKSTGMTARDRIIIQELTDANYKQDYPDFTAVGKEIIISGVQDLINCKLIVSENYNNLDTLENGKVDLNELERNLTGAGEIYDEAVGRARAIAQTFLRDAYKNFGNKRLQDAVPFLCHNSNVGNNPTPYSTSKGLICAVCAGEIQSGTNNWDNVAIRQSWDVDHIANLIFNELFKLNDPRANNDGRGFLNTCGTCNRQFKSEKLWSPSWDLWFNLVVKSLPEDELNNNTIKARLSKLQWPGRLAPGVIKNAEQPFQGYRTYMTQAYYSSDGPTRAQSYDVENSHKYSSVEEVRAGVQLRTGPLQQAEGINFTDRQEKKGGPQRLESEKLEGIILNRFRLLCETELGKSILQFCNQNRPQRAIGVIREQYDLEVSMFGPFARAMNMAKERRQANSSGIMGSDDEEAHTALGASQGTNDMDSQGYGFSQEQNSQEQNSQEQNSLEENRLDNGTSASGSTTPPPTDGKVSRSPVKTADDIIREVRTGVWQVQSDEYLANLSKDGDRRPSYRRMGRTSTVYDDNEGPRGEGITMKQLGKLIYNYIKQNRLRSVRAIWERKQQNPNNPVYIGFRNFLNENLPNMNRNYIQSKYSEVKAYIDSLEIQQERLKEEYEKCSRRAYLLESPQEKRKLGIENALIKNERRLVRLYRTRFVLIELHSLIMENIEKNQKLPGSAKSDRRAPGRSRRRSRGDSINKQIFGSNDASAAELANEKDTSMGVEHDEGGKTSGQDSAIERATQAAIERATQAVNQSINPGGDAYSLNNEIYALRNWFIAAQQQLQLPAGEVREGRDPSLIETANRPSELHWWSNDLILIALRTFAPNINWVVGRNENGGVVEITDPNRNIVIYHSGQGQNEHWNIAIRPDSQISFPQGSINDNGYYVVPDLNEMLIDDNFAHHRNGGDCGPAAVALALRAVKNRYQLSNVLYMARLRYNLEVGRRQLLEIQQQQQQQQKIKAQQKTLNNLIEYAVKEGKLSESEELEYRRRMAAENITMEELRELEAELTELVSSARGGKRTRKNRRRKNKTKNKRKRRYKTKKHKRKKNKTHRKR